MKRWVATLVLIPLAGIAAVSAPKGPQIEFVDNKLSIDAEAVPLARLLHLVDFATGMSSKVPPELANRNISVKFSGLNVSDGVRKIFQGQPLDYVVIDGRGVIVTAASQASSSADSLPPFNPPASAQPVDQPFVQEFPPGQQPAMVQTPFGPIPNPRAQQQQVQPNAPLNIPGQQNSLFPAQPGQQQNSLFPNQPAQQQQPVVQPQTIPGVPGLQPGNPNPFATPSPFGAQNPPVTNQNNGLFGTPGAQQR